ncbi:hypothetical protein [Geodermatophilus marinus]|uniref:hypothetical protein n=1 Tax=Geodermatophilus sp. LHW52908 TaxID=2303986 RepID=UPI001314F348|nr:hypothetical protein [Geodermatophilus sp. LHW52908]
MCTTPTSPTTRRYAADIVAMHDRMTYARLLDHLPQDDLPHLAVRGDGLVTVAATTEQLPHRYLLGLQGFRLAQYLQLGWACEEALHRSAGFCEPLQALHPDDVHVLTASSRTGRILGYLSLTTSGDVAPRELRDPDRARFPVEAAHRIDLFDRVPAPEGVRSDGVRELKRFVHARTLTDRAQRLRVTLELLLGAGRTLLAVEPAVQVLVGDVEEDVALRHLLLAGLEVHLVEDTEPWLPDDDLLHLAYTRRGAVKPFVAGVPDVAELRQRIELLEATLASEDLFEAADAFAGAVRGATRRVAA